MHKFIQSLANDERGVTALEYAILGGAIVVVLGAGAVGFRTALGEAFEALATALTDATTP